MSKTVEFIGGPLDGMKAPNDRGCFHEGDVEAVNTLQLADPSKGEIPAVAEPISNRIARALG